MFRSVSLQAFVKRHWLKGIGFDCLALFPDRPTVMEDIANTAKQANLFIMYQQLGANRHYLKF